MLVEIVVLIAFAIIFVIVFAFKSNIKIFDTEKGVNK